MTKFAAPVLAAGVAAATLAAPATAAETAASTEPAAGTKGCFVTKNLPYGTGTAKCTSKEWKKSGYHVWIQCNNGKIRFGPTRHKGVSRAVCPSVMWVTDVGVLPELDRPSS